ncbi:hypothetical protein VNO77_04979 [Canavalia gladiata]|uniref:Uncharacterized protein n=1 Tax=Canavalia gladiata TaxID=3824 RepID=A0AAN9R581_CANGL
MQFLMRPAAVYTYAKEPPGPAVRTVEEAVKSVVGPVYEKFHLLPDELLRHADFLPDELIDHADRKPEPSVSAAHGASAAARTSASDIARTVCAKCEPAANVLYERYEGKTASAWQRLNRVRLLPRVAEKYNEAVMAAAEKSSAYLHVMPVEKIGKVFKEK